MHTSAVAKPNSCSLISTLELFEQQCSDSPSSVAIVHGDRTLTYCELDCLANQFASVFAQHGLQSGGRVGICMEKRPDAIAAMLGAFKLGAAFVPLDPAYPADRIHYMVHDANIGCVATFGADADALMESPELKGLQWIDANELPMADPEYSFGSSRPAADSLAYVMYTSGSTGKPKGVLIDHGALTTYCLADIEIYQLSAKDRTLQFSSLNFDIAIEEIFPPLLVGGSVVIRPLERASCSNELSKICRDFNVTAIHLATAYWHEWVDLLTSERSVAPESLRLVIATGEKVSVEHYQRWKRLGTEGILWCNAYGPTETTVTATVFIPPSDFHGEQMPIGKPLPGYDCYILDEEYRALGVGQTGHLFISGRALAIGYLNRPDLTERAFVNVEMPEIGTVRMYRTGDLARWNSDGNIDFSGRVDHQMKFGSYRIEPGEIEGYLNQLPGVQESLVVLDQKNGRSSLVAYVVTPVDGALTVASIVDGLKQRLPDYMVPRRFILMDSLPKTVNGKIDRAALPSADKAVSAVGEDFEAPKTKTQIRLAELWQEVLQVPQVGLESDFFALGGSSLLVTRVIAGIQDELGIQLPVRDFFANPTLQAIATHIDRLAGHVTNTAIASGEHLATSAWKPVLRPLFIGPDTRQLFAVHYRPHPNQSSPRRNHAVLMCHALGLEYTRSYRNLQQLALLLTKQGFDVLRFDYYGTGNSTGGSRSTRVESMLADVRSAAEWLTEMADCEAISLLGVRAGATVAAQAELTELKHGSLRSVVLWDPVIDGRSMLRTFARHHAHALTSGNRFAHVVTDAEPNQMVGHSTNEDQQASFASLRLPAQEPNYRNLVLFSHDYESREANASELRLNWNVVDVQDDIYWHDSTFTESAFSSPDAYRSILKFLAEESL